MSYNKLKQYEDKKLEENTNSFFDSNFELYPPVKDFYDSSNQYDIYKNKKKAPIFLNNGINEEMNSDIQEENTYEINADFFGSLLGKNNYDLNKEKKINTISKIIRKSKLMEKLEKEYDGTNKKNNLEVLSNMCAKNLSFMELKKGKVLFKIGDKGDRFYFILSGKITILKPREINSKMSLQEYLYYLLILIKEKEDYLFHEVILKNCAQVPITTVEEVKSIYRILFLMSLKIQLNNETIDNNKQLKNYFDKHFQNFHEYNIEINLLEILEQKKSKLTGNKQWNNYILRNCNLTKADIKSLERFKEYKEKKNIIYYAYDTIIYLGPGFFFGDAALEEKVNKRNATIRAEEDTVLGFLKSVDYSNMIAPQRKLEKMKEINFLINNFFFRNINIPIFEKSLFHIFTLNENNRGTTLFNCGDIPKHLMFLKEGNLSLTLQCSIIEINNIIENICNTFIKKYSEELIKKNIISKEKINILKEYIKDDRFFSNLKKYTKKFVNEINKKRTFQIAVYDGIETIGLEEVFLGIPYITKSNVMSEKIIYYKFDIDKIQTNLLENHHISYFYIKSAVNKIFSLIERLKNLKQNYIDIAKMRHENPNSFRSKKLPILKNTKNNLIQNNIETFSTLGYNISSSRLLKKMINLSRNIATEKKEKEKEYQILSYSENKPYKKNKNSNLNININNGNDLYMNIVNYKSPLSKNPYLNNNIFLSVLLDSKKSNKLFKEKNPNHKKNINFNLCDSPLKNSNYLNYFKKEKRNSIISLKINEHKEEDDLKRPKIKNKIKRFGSSLNVKSKEGKKIGNKILSADRIRRKIRNSGFKKNNSSKQLIEIIRTKKYNVENQKNTSNNYFQKELNNNSSFVTENNINEKNTSILKLKREISSIIRNQKINNFNLIQVPLLNEDEDYNIFKTHLKINTNNNIINNDNYISLLINKPNTSRDDNKLSKNNLILQKNFSFNNKKNKLILHKLLFNKKSKTKKNNSNINLLKSLKIDSSNDTININQKNNEIIFISDSSFNNNNSNNGKYILPTISHKNLDINNFNDLQNWKINQKVLIPQIIRNYYNDKKMKGYASLIPNKESNTLFLRKFHKKYHLNEQNTSKNKKKEN